MGTPATHAAIHEAEEATPFSTCSYSCDASWRGHIEAGLDSPDRCPRRSALSCPILMAGPTCGGPSRSLAGADGRRQRITPY
ncbi:hypothetical protein NDU88_001031 [Pleurodeles waltl]|uniref:Uncharacterized protein n=1 Tax=Pleurodeles waltl TaxID=8319 RepID=A0AAV7N9N1_PLEWA|nr:hypothetical protein NDU88_001031 [Pleurodeles waltl]